MQPQLCGQLDATIKQELARRHGLIFQELETTSWGVIIKNGNSFHGAEVHIKVDIPAASRPGPMSTVVTTAAEKWWTRQGSSDRGRASEWPIARILSTPAADNDLWTYWDENRKSFKGATVYIRSIKGANDANDSSDKGNLEEQFEPSPWVGLS